MSEAVSGLSVPQLLLFTELCWQLAPYVDLHRTDPNSPSIVPPHNLPPKAVGFIADCMFKGQTAAFADAVTKLWYAQSDFIWQSRDHSREATHLLDLFLEFGPQHEIGFISIGPPTRFCTDPACTTRRKGYPTKLGEERTHGVTLFTKRYGPLPSFSSSLYCRACHTRYYHDYYVHDQATSRTYYRRTMPTFIHIAQHFFLEVSLCELFANMMVHVWSSATNCARIYNEAIGWFEGHRRYQFQSEIATVMDTDNIWDGFFIHSLLLDAQRRMCILTLPHSGIHHSNRYSDALLERNQLYTSFERPEWNHVCHDCFKLVESGWVRSVVVDGVTIGHPCCSVHDCKVPLGRVKDRFCHLHQAEARICVIVNCRNLASNGFRTCAEPTCRSVEEYTELRNKAMFRLKNTHHYQQRQAVENGLMETGEGDEEVDSSAANAKDAPGSVKRKGRFSRRWTHNEELCVASCGVILGRATFFGSEAPNGVKMFLHHLFPEAESLPTYIWYDNNCQLLKILDPDDPLRLIALPVDVFHFQCKHKEGDKFCGENCNPALWPDLIQDGKWLFNSSVAEQTNAWFGGFQSMAREMRMDRYNFFLDEMIRRRNDWLIRDSSRKDKDVRTIPHNILLPHLFASPP